MCVAVEGRLNSVRQERSSVRMKSLICLMFILLDLTACREHGCQKKEAFEVVVGLYTFPNVMLSELSKLNLIISLH